MPQLSPHNPWVSFDDDDDDDDDDNDGIECIDLTASPDPNPPRRTPLQQPPINLKKEANMHPVTRLQPVSSSFQRHVTADRAASHIHPDHMRRIITTSDAAAVQTVLLNLCKLSPALSGAIARGLAPHSAFAQAIIRQDQQRPAAPTIKSDPECAARSSINNVQTPAHVTPSSTPRIKPEPEIITVLSDDEDGLHASLFPMVAPRSPTSTSKHREASAGPSRPRVKAEPSSSTNQFPYRPASSAYQGMQHSHSLTQPSRVKVESNHHSPGRIKIESKHTAPARVKTEPQLDPPGKKCKNCSRTFESDANEPNSCIHHAGRKIVTIQHGERVTMYSCCRLGISSRGCTAGYHIPEPAQDTALYDASYHFQYREGPSTPQPRDLKRPRLS